MAPFTTRVRVAPFTATTTVRVRYTYTVRVRDRCVRWDRQRGGCMTWSYRTETRSGCCRTQTRTRAVYNYQTRQAYNYRTRAAFNYETRQVFNYRTRAAFNYETRAVYNYQTRQAFNYRTQAVFNYVPVYETRTRSVITVHPARLACGAGFTRSGAACTRRTPAQPRCESATPPWTLSGWTCTRRVEIAPTGCPTGHTLNQPTGTGPYMCTPASTISTATSTTTTRPPARACSATTDLGPLRSATEMRKGSWSASAGCLSTQRGNPQTPYYAHTYTFTLTAAGRVSASVASKQAVKLYLLSDPYTVDDLPLARGGAEVSAGPLPVGDYIIEVARSVPRRTNGAFTLTVGATTAPCDDGEVRVWGGSCSPRKGVYGFTLGTVVSTRDVASTAHGRKPSGCALTVDQLTALMLTIPVHELQRPSPSPMFLGRSDNIEQNPESIWLYSRKTREHERRAHWHAGVGLWQLDKWPAAQNLNHAERADIRTGGIGVAEHIRDRFCDNGGKLDWAEKVYRPWFGCKPDSSHDKKNRDLCKATYPKIYDGVGDSLRVAATAGASSNGGVQDRSCIWSSRKPPARLSGFDCFLYDPARHEGNMDVAKVEGTDSAANPNGFTPLATAFISLTNPDGTHSGTKYAVFPAARTGYAHTLIKAVPEDEYSRSSRLGPNSNGWYEGVVDGRALYVREGTSEECADPEAATAAACEWVRM